MQRVAAEEIQHEGVELPGSFEIRHVAAPFKYIKVGVRYLFSGKARMLDGKETVLSPPDNQGRNLNLIEILHDRVEDIRACTMDGRAGAEDIENCPYCSQREIKLKMDVYQRFSDDCRIVH